MLVVRVTVAKISDVLFGWIGLGWVVGRVASGSVRDSRDASVRPMSDRTALRRSPLHDRHVALGAKMADFGGWEMPIEYPGGGVVKEHTAVREAVGLFDVSHLGKAVGAWAGRGGVRQCDAQQRPRPGGSGQGAVHAVLRRR